MKLDMIGIITKNMAKSIEFYALLGFISNGAATEEYVELAHEGIRISLNTSKMIAGYETFKEPCDAFWGQRYAIIKDPDGNFLSLFANLPTK